MNRTIQNSQYYQRAVVNVCFCFTDKGNFIEDILVIFHLVSWQGSNNGRYKYKLFSQILCSEPVWHITIHQCKDIEVISVTLESPSTLKTPRTYTFQSPSKICTPVSQRHFKLNTPKSECLLNSSNSLFSLVWFGATVPCPVAQAGLELAIP